MSQTTILVVEDDPGLLEGIRTILELDGYTVITADNGVNALEILRSTTALPNLIVSDIMMPQMDGIQLLQAVRKQPGWVTVPFIFLTARSSKADIQRGKKLGVDDYLIKPFDAEDLLVAVESRLERHKALNEAQTGTVANVKRNILTILNHEFRTPLTFVVAYADMLNSHNTDQIEDAEMLAFLKGVGSGATRLRRLIENFILLVELETGDAARTYEWRRNMITDLPELFESVFERVEQLGSAPQMHQIDIHGSIPPFVGDREYLSAALCQLISNAVKFSPPDKPVTLGAAVIGSSVQLWVEDQGRGIPEPELDQIWETFYQVNRAYHEDQGTGSGLAIVRGIAQMHSGSVQVESQHGVGSKFTLVLPLGNPYPAR